MVTVKLVQSAAKSISSFLSALWNSHVHHGIMTCIIMFVPTDSWSLEHSTKINNNHYKLKSLSYLRLVKTEQNRSAIFLNQCLWCHLGAVRLGSHLRQNWDKFVLITEKSVKFLSSVDHAKCELLVSTQTKTFCKQKQKIVFLVINLPVNSVKLIFFFASHFTFRCDLCIVHENHECRISKTIFPAFGTSIPIKWWTQMKRKTAIGQGSCFLRQQNTQHSRSWVIMLCMTMLQRVIIPSTPCVSYRQWRSKNMTFITIFFLFRHVHNKTIISFSCCDIQNNQGLSKGYKAQSRPWLFWISQKPHPVNWLLLRNPMKTTAARYWKEIESKLTQIDLGKL